jgi:hypothetical protein
MNDGRWTSSEGWAKMAHRAGIDSTEPIEVHYLYNSDLNMVDDFKIVVEP